VRKIINIYPVRENVFHSYTHSNRAGSIAVFAPVLTGIALATTLLAGAAAAADMTMPMKAAAAAPVFNWTGCYVGINGGGAASGSDFTSRVDPGTHLVDPGDLAIAGATGTGSANDAGFIGGGQVGCNLQSGGFAFGIEGDWDYFKSTPTFTNPNGVLGTGDAVTISQSLRTSSLATIRPRLGMVTDRNFLYATGGVAFARVNYVQTYADTTANPAVGTAAGSTTLVGWTVGGGWEWAWTDHVTLKTEYLFAKFPTTNVLGGIADNVGLANALHGSYDLTIQTARLGLNYKF
jgi:outer membrane immunogenic protein